MENRIRPSQESMIDKKQFLSAVTQIAEDKGLDRMKIIEAIETAMAAAYKKDYGKKSQIIRATLDVASGDVKFSQIKIVVDDSMLKPEGEEEDASEDDRPEEEVEGVKKVRFNEERHIMIEEAKKTKEGVMLGDEIVSPLETPQDYGRIAAQTAKQIIIQKLKEVEKETVFSEFKSKEGEVVSGVIQRIEPRHIVVDLGKTLGYLPVEEQVRSETYRSGMRIRALILSVLTTPRGSHIILSRSHPKFVAKIFDMEVPEVNQGTVVIKAIAREAGSRTKIAVTSSEEGIDPIGSCIGQKGTRITTIISELGGEKVDVIEWSEDAGVFIKNALSPAKVVSVEVKPYREAVVLVPEDQLSLAIGKGGQNVRLAAKLTGWKIDIRSAAKPEEVVQGGMARSAEEGGSAEEAGAEPPGVVTKDSPEEHK